MTNLAPNWMWWGLAATAVPIILHFFYRARYRPVPWGAMKFLRLSIEQTSRRLRFQELILLILRVLVCLLLALALLRLTSCDAKTITERGKTVDVIFIFDTSYSMAAKELDNKGRPRTRLDVAKAQALRYISKLPENSTVRVITCSDVAMEPERQSPSNLDQVKRVIESIEITHRKTNMLPAMDAALLALAQCASDSKEVVIFSDMQRFGWERQSTEITSRHNEIRSRAELIIKPTWFPDKDDSEKDDPNKGDPGLANVTITDIIPQQEMPQVNSRIPFTVILHNSGTVALDGLKLVMVLDGQVLEKDVQNVGSLQVGEKRPITITAKIETPGRHIVSAAVFEDALEVDNHFSTSVFVRDKLRVLIIDGNPTESGDPAKAGAFFLANAITPVSSDQLDSYFIQRRVIRAADAIPESLTEMDLCVLVDVPLAGASTVSDEFVDSLKQFVRSGHSLLVTSGTNVMVTRNEYNQRIGDILPVRLENRDPIPFPADKQVTPDLQSIDESSFLAKFKEPGNRIGEFMSAASTTRVLPVAEPKGATRTEETGRVILRFTDGQPMIVGRQVGEGKAFLLTTSVFRGGEAKDAWSELVANPAFPALIDRFIAHLAHRQNTNLSITAGEALRWEPTDRTATYYALKPLIREDQRYGERFVALGKSTLLERSLLISDTSVGGIYRIGTEEYRNRILERERAGAPIDESAGSTLAFSVVPDLKESESFDSMTKEQIRELLKVEIKREGEKPEWTWYILIALLIFALVETAWAWYCGRAW